jgi:hypothetical protein
MKNLWVKGKRQFLSRYVFAEGDRVFQLVPVKSGKIYSFESWQAAKKAGWVKTR